MLITYHDKHLHLQGCSSDSVDQKDPRVLTKSQQIYKELQIQVFWTKQGFDFWQLISAS